MSIINTGNILEKMMKARMNKGGERMGKYIEAVQWMYGMSKREAEKYIRNCKKNGEGGKQRLDIILDSFGDNARKSFYED